MELMENLGELQKAANYVTLRRTLRPFGIGAMIFGILTVLAGVPVDGVDALSVFLLALGLLLVVTATLVLSAPSPAGLQLAAVAVMVVGFSNILTTVLDAVAGKENGVSAFFFFFGILQIGFAIKMLKDYRHFAKLLSGQPDQEMVARVDRMVKSLLKAKAKSDNTVVEMYEKEGAIAPMWKGKFLENAAIFVKKAGRQDVTIARKDDVNFAERAGPAKRGQLPASFRIGDKKLIGAIAPEHFKRYEAWKSLEVADD